MKRFIVTAALGAGLLVTPLFTSGAAADPPGPIRFLKVTENCTAGDSITPHWTSGDNPSFFNQFLRENRELCGKLTGVEAGVQRP